MGDALTRREVFGGVGDDQMLRGDGLGGWALLQRVREDRLEARAAEVAPPQQHMRRLRSKLGRRGSEKVIHVALERLGQLGLLLDRIDVVVSDLAWPLSRQ